MSELHGGTVTFVFTDIEGSTRLLERLGDRYAGALADHRRIVREAFAERGGRELDTQGDSFFYAFERARDAVAATVAAQRSLETHAWPDGERLRVRMSVHTGEPVVGEEGYVGLDVHRAARICAAGHGGQVLLSSTTAALVTGALPSGVSKRDMGDVQLKDIEEPERLVQLEIEGLSSSFPRSVRSRTSRSISANGSRRRSRRTSSVSSRRASRATSSSPSPRRRPPRSRSSAS